MTGLLLACHFEQSEKSFPKIFIHVGERKFMGHFVVKFSSGEPFHLAQDMLGASLMQESKMQRNYT
jgi:hypothetical protein